MSDNSKPLLELKDLNITFSSSGGDVHAVRGANLEVYPGETVAIVGESGSGKSTTAMSVIGLLPKNGKIEGGSIVFNGEDLTKASEKRFQQIRGAEIGLVPQDPMSNLNPVWKIGAQVTESLKANNALDGADKDEKVAQLLTEAGLPDAAKKAKQYPHEFSGGMRQRALIGIGLAARPQLLIADEPTSALDVTVQRKILDHLASLTEELGTAVLLVTHDLGLAAERAEHLVVMHRGRVVESGPSQEILQDPQHPYTQRLVQAAPSINTARYSDNVTVNENSDAADSQSTSGEPINADNDFVIEVANLTKEFAQRGRGKDAFKAVDDVSFNVRRGTTLAMVGESGSGKSTIANMVLQLLEPTSGTIKFNGEDVSKFSKKQLFNLREKMQVVFQNPYGSLDPMYSIYKSIEEPLILHKRGNRKERQKRVAELLDMVAMPASTMQRFPNELSGGQRQRIAIARAMALNPEVLVLDEAVSALDVLVQDQILKLLQNLQDEHNLSYLFITHDLAVVRQSADDVVVLQNGNLVEKNTTENLFRNAEQEYTRNLINSVPGMNIKLGNGQA
ncbi:dipeptide ABC transporter ATP-binding protein [Corynebacterium pseudodiphtheriticum]|uniref:ABC transporter ATP-binding protein n=1 Tax=Corynebacterium pseudodiphtheriticum TaxID=37637 RepID=A0ABT7FY37_9CORY|nr:ABC transporter ATP-binding protein [Corynebacterium pseudodiphtheriticum]MDK4290902.1 ABC transporter ATP-binding protein [Corynebacterium pseudodiphtheriticum]MDK8396927.1 ABC transporter ATP-binding protein [Corynebacterium pseudodiphtheriticum]MDK8683316.1 ABC transporter ATP-binding protein [Corynebacterium pseudodiphtheriticum]MDK8805516.1 ABC transporter ATP-binding protein [Corynebacterium pseudodiphtheriticum]RUP91126.1 ABC transporter ATP-binding protein [Corynebacterium pseudodip